MSIPVVKNLVPTSKYSIKCPYPMNAEYITIHNTANDASARNEIAYMISNNLQVSYHFAVDDKEVVQGLPLNRNGWHCGDGGNGPGNRKSIGVEICYSKSGGERYRKAEQLAIKFIAQLLHERGWGMNRVRTHQQWNGKYCPHRILSEGRLQQVLNAIEAELNRLKGKKETPSPSPKPSSPTPAGEFHTIQKGDTFWSLSRKYNIPVATLEKLNPNVNPNKLSIGQRIRLKPAQSQPVSNTGTHVIEKGDTFWSLSKKYNTTVDNLKAMNPNVNPNALSIGQKINVPTSGNVASTPKPAPKPSYVGKRVEALVDVRFYNKPSWADKDVAGICKKGLGFTIVDKIKVGNGEQYKVKNSKGKVFYITASSKYVRVV